MMKSSRAKPNWPFWGQFTWQRPKPAEQPISPRFAWGMGKIFWSTFLTALLISLGQARPVAAAEYSYSDSEDISFNEIISDYCLMPITRTVVVPEQFVIRDLNVVLQISHEQRADVRVILQSPIGTRVELITDFYAEDDNATGYRPDKNANYFLLLDSASTEPLNSTTDDDIGAQEPMRTAQPTESLDQLNGQLAQGQWIIEICDSGDGADGTYHGTTLHFDGQTIFEHSDATDPMAPIRGRAYRDYNSNGKNERTEPGIAAITVTAYDDSGATIAETVTDAQGIYTLTTPISATVRVEFTAIPVYLSPGVMGTDSGSTVIFIASPALDVDVALHNAGQYCQAADKTELALSCYRYGPLDGPFANEASIMTFRETDGSATSDPDTYGITVITSTAQTTTGSVWGMAYDPVHRQVFAGAVIKRHIGLGPTDNPTTIYAFSPDSGATAPWYTHDSSRPNPHATTTDYIEDFDAFDAVGKEGWGDVDIADDFSALYAVDLGERAIVKIAINEDGSAGEVAKLALMAHLPAELIGSGTTACPTGDDLRPYGLGIHDGVVYGGLVCSAQSTVPAGALPLQAPILSAGIDTTQRPGDFSRLHGYIFAWNGDTTAPEVTWLVDFPLDYDRGCGTYNPKANCETNFAGTWAPWIDTFPYNSFGNSGMFEAVYPQPLISDIEFDNGNMVIFVMDRFGHQVGGFARSHYNENIFHVAQMSDTLYACKQADGWTMEALLSGDKSCSTPGRSFVRGSMDGADRVDEYFFEDSYRIQRAIHDDVGLGAGLKIPGRSEVINVVFDPASHIDSKLDIFAGGLHWYSTDDGRWRKGARAYQGTGNILTDGTLAKAGGLGDLVALCDLAPVEIGNRVWRDDNRNGIQDPNEPPLTGVTVELHQNDQLIATSVTDEHGNYIFSSAPMTSTTSHQYGLDLQLKTAYTVKIPNAVGPNQQSALTALELTETDDQDPSPSGSDRSDSDGMLTGNDAVISITIDAVGANNHTYDFGFFGRYSVGNLVWFDTVNDAKQAPTEPPLADVILSLYDVNGTPADFDDDMAITTTSTSELGLYLFLIQRPGDYYVQVDPVNFVTGGALAGCESSNDTLDEDDPNLDIDTNDNGHQMTGYVRSGIISIATDEPLSEDPDNDPDTPDTTENLTVDFGFHCVRSAPTNINEEAEEPINWDRIFVPIVNAE